MNFKQLLGLTGLSMLLGSAAMAATFECGSVDKAYKPYYAGKLYTVGMTRTCQIHASGQKNVADAFALIRELVKAEGQVTSGPEVAQLEGMTAEKYTLATVHQASGGEIHVDNDALIASDLMTKVKVETHSTKVSGTGMGQYVRSTTTNVDFSVSGAAGEFTIVMSAGLQVEKPVFVPGSFVEGPTENAVRDTLAGRSDQMLPKISQALD